MIAASSATRISDARLTRYHWPNAHADLHEDDIGRLDCHVHPRAERHADVSSRERWRVVHAVADKGDHVASLLHPAHLPYTEV